MYCVSAARAEKQPDGGRLGRASEAAAGAGRGVYGPTVDFVDAGNELMS